MLRSGPLLPALLASSAIPGIYPAVDHTGCGSTTAAWWPTSPMRQAVAMGARSLVVLDCFFPGQLPRSTDTIADILLYTALVTMHSQRCRRRPGGREHPGVYCPDRRRGSSRRWTSPIRPNDRGRVPLARQFLDELHVDGPGLYQRPPERGSSVSAVNDRVALRAGIPPFYVMDVWLPPPNVSARTAIW